MSRPLSIAMAHSIAIHGVLFWIVSVPLIQVSNPEVADIVLDVSLEIPQRDHASEASSDLPESSLRGESTYEEEDAPALDISDPNAVVGAPTDFVIDGLEIEIAPQPDPGQTTIHTDRTDGRDEYEARRLIAAPTANASIPLSARQRKMLARKLKRLSENFDKFSRREGGWRFKHRGQVYVAHFRELPATEDTGLDRVIVDVTTVAEGQQLATKAHMRRLAFSNYAQFVDRWDPNVEVHNDELDGRVHANSKLVLSYDRTVRPKFLGKVTTAARDVDFTEGFGRVRRHDIFLGGLETGVRQIRLPKHYRPIPDNGTAKNTQVHYIQQQARITFYADGTYAWQTLDTGPGGRRRVTTDDSFYIIATKGARLHIKGTINGTVLVYSPEGIVIEGNLVYAEDPESSRDADDFLGLVSEKHVVVAVPDVTGPGDLLIQASIYAKRRFSVSAYGEPSGDLLHIYGSLVAGSLSATEPRFRTKVTFDPRLHERRPPGFPVTDRYEIVSWNQSWQIQ